MSFNRMLSTFSNFTIRIVGAVVVSFLLFSLISMLHGMFSIEPQVDKPIGRQETLVELVKPPPEQDRQARQRIRQVQQVRSEARGEAGDRMSMRFTPDLSVDAGAGGGVVELAQHELSAEVFEEGQTDQDPREVYMPPLVYDDRARDRNISGTVVAQFIISYDGKATDVQIISSPHPLLSASVKKTISGSKFMPGKNKGIPVNVRVRKAFEFNLE